MCLILHFIVQITAQSCKYNPQLGRIESNAKIAANTLRVHIGDGIAQSNGKADSEELSAFHKMRMDVEQQVIDYRDFLKVKTKYNVPSTSMNKFPGLVHFIYVDRHRDLVLCPTLQTAEDDGKGLGEKVDDA